TLFGNNTGSGSKKEIMLSITPRIIRPPAAASAETHEVYSGTESAIRVRPLRLDSVSAAAGGAPAAAGAVGAAGATGAGGNGSAAASPFTSPGGVATPGTGASEGGAAPPGTAASGASGSPGAAPAAGNAAAPGGAPLGGLGAATAAPGAEAGTTAPRTPAAVVPATPPAPVNRTTIPPSIRPGAIYRPSAVPVPPAPSTPPVKTPGAESVKAAPLDLPAVAGSGGELRWSGPRQAQIGAHFTVEVAAVDLPGLRRWPLVVRYDPLVMRFVEAVPAASAAAAGATLQPARVDSMAGRVELALQFPKSQGTAATTTAAAAAAAEQPLVALTFAAVSPRAQTQLLVSALDAKGEDDRPPRRLKTTP
ncbi:MAG: hypothetical protein JNL30_08900, partial [Rubrivivax sp.]|nr:hypothetical protein [Rubrivivax sp.]